MMLQATLAKILPWIVAPIVLFLRYSFILVPIFVGISAFFLAQGMLPWMQQRIGNKTGTMTDWMVVRLDQMFIKVSRSKCQAALLLSTVMFAGLGFAASQNLGALTFMFTA